MRPLSVACLAAFTLVVSGCCRRGESKADLQAKQEAWDREIKRAAPPPSFDNLVDAKAIAEAIAGSSKPAKHTADKASQTTADDYAAPEGMTVVRENDTPAIRAMLRAMPLDGLGPTEPVCQDPSGVTYLRITAGPLAGSFYSITSKGSVFVDNEDMVRRRGWQTCAAKTSCESRRGLPKEFTRADFLVACQSKVRAQLKAPSRAEFPGFGEGPRPEYGRNCRLEAESWVDAPNAFNAMLRSKWSCTWDPTTDLMETKLQ